MPRRGVSRSIRLVLVSAVLTLAWALLLQGLLGVGAGDGTRSAPASSIASIPPTTPAGSSTKSPGTLEGPTSAYLRHEYESPQVRLRSGDGARGDFSSGVGWLAYANWDSSFYVAAPPSSVDQVTAADFYELQAVIPVGYDPFGVAVDPAAKEVFVTNMGSDNVSVINGTTQLPIASVTVQSNPEGIAFDATDNSLFVADNGSNNVSVISVATLSVVANVSVGTTPAGVAWDNASDRIFVTNRGSDNVSVISGATNRVLASVNVGSSPFGLADDNTTGTLYVANEGSNNVSVISASPAALNASVPIATSFFEPPPHLEDVAYDSIHHMIWVTAGLTVVVIDAAAARAVDEVAFDPSGIAFDPDNGDVCETNSVNLSSGCFVYGAPDLNRDPSVTFSEQGLPSGVGWNVTMGAGASSVNQSSDGPNVTFGVDAGLQAYVGCPCGYSYPYSVASPVVGSAPQTFSGNVSNYSQGSENETVKLSFHTAGEYGVSFQETGLPPSVDWGVNLSGTFASASSGAAVAFGAVNGSYNFTIGTIEGYTSALPGGSVTVNGSPVQVNISWVAVSLYPITFNETGLPPRDNWSVSLVGTTESAIAGGSISFTEPNGSYGFAVGSVTGYRATPDSGSLTVSGSSSMATIAFVREPSYAVFFTESGLPGGRAWSVNLSGAVESETVQGGVPSNLTFSEQNGTFSFQVGAVTGYTAQPSSGPLTVNGAASLIQITFTALPEATYEVNFTETGLSGGTNWSVTLGMTTESSPTDSIVFAEPNGTYAFVVNSPSGLTASPDRGSILVNGSDVPEFIVFSAIPVPLSANFSFEIQSAGCETDGGVTNLVVLSALANGGSPPYSYSWTLPTGSATTALTSTTTTFGQGNFVTLVVSDAGGHTATRSAQLPMELPPCPPLPFKSTAVSSFSIQDWAIVGLAVALVAVTGAAIRLGTRGKGGSPGIP
jgi:YVTN family beta-propeller protein